MVVLPPRRLRQRHQDRLDPAARLQAEDRTSVIHEVELDVTAAAQLLHANADVNLAAKDGATALYLACVYGYSDCVGILLSQTALDCNRARSDGITPLFMACQRGHTQIVKELLGKDRWIWSWTSGPDWLPWRRATEERNP